MKGMKQKETKDKRREWKKHTRNEQLTVESYVFRAKSDVLGLCNFCEELELGASNWHCRAIIAINGKNW